MNDKTRRHRPHQISRFSQAVRDLTTWASDRRRTALRHTLRGACYGAGSGTIGLIVFWLERH